jgi:hypothetical protein
MVGFCFILAASMVIACREVRAQSLGSSAASLAPPPAATAAAPYGPAQFPMYPVARTTGTDMVGIGSYSNGSNMFNNPFAAPLLYGTMSAMSPSQSLSASQSSSSAGEAGGLSPTQMGFMMMASSPQMMGINSGQASNGARRGGGFIPGTGAAMAGSSGRGRSAQPGGLAARYFNRTAAMTRIPQGYFNRQTRYFPESGR